MLFVGFLYTFAQVSLVLIVLTLLTYMFPDNLFGRTAALIK